MCCTVHFRSASKGIWPNDCIADFRESLSGLMTCIDWFWLWGWLINKGAICTRTAPLFWNFISLFQGPRTRLVRKIGSQNQSIVYSTRALSHCNILQHTATLIDQSWGLALCTRREFYRTATYCKTLQHTTHLFIRAQDSLCVQDASSVALQHTATHCNTLQHTAQFVTWADDSRRAPCRDL